MSHVIGSEELPFLHVDRPAALGRGYQSRSAGSRTRDLQNIDDFGDGFDLRHGVKVGQHRCSDRIAYFGEDLEPGGQPRSTERIDRCPIGLVEDALNRNGMSSSAATAPTSRAIPMQCSRLSDDAGTRDESSPPDPNVMRLRCSPDFSCRALPPCQP